jgi:phospholipase/carboxylesterase
VLSVRAPIEVAPFAFAWFHERPTPNGMVSDAAELARASAAIQSFVDEAAAAYAADADRTYLAGFSQGGALALATVVAAPDAIRGAVCMSGRLPREVLPAAANRDRRRGHPAVLILHGVGDETLRIEEARAARTTLQALDIPVEYRELEMGHTTTPESLAAASAWLAAQLDR